MRRRFPSFFFGFLPSVPPRPLSWGRKARPALPRQEAEMRQNGPKTLLNGSFSAKNRPSICNNIPWIGRSIPWKFSNIPWIDEGVGGANAAKADNERFTHCGRKWLPKTASPCVRWQRRRPSACVSRLLCEHLRAAFAAVAPCRRWPRRGGSGSTARGTGGRPRRAPAARAGRNGV